MQQIGFRGGLVKVAPDYYVNPDKINKIVNDNGNTAILLSDDNYTYIKTPVSEVAAACIKAQATSQIVDLTTSNKNN